jgi:hypothetical protein
MTAIDSIETVTAMHGARELQLPDILTAASQGRRSDNCRNGHGPTMLQLPETQLGGSGRCQPGSLTAAAMHGSMVLQLPAKTIDTYRDSLCHNASAGKLSKLDDNLPHDRCRDIVYYNAADTTGLQQISWRNWPLTARKIDSMAMAMLPIRHWRCH